MFLTAARPIRNMIRALREHWPEYFLERPNWIYFVAPVLAMQLAAETYLRSRRTVYCAKLHHHNDSRCFFNCSFGELLE
jgi:hypothetical protein